MLLCPTNLIVSPPSAQLNKLNVPLKNSSLSVHSPQRKTLSPLSSLVPESPLRPPCLSPDFTTKKLPLERLLFLQALFPTTFVFLFDPKTKKKKEGLVCVKSLFSKPHTHTHDTSHSFS